MLIAYSSLIISDVGSVSWCALKPKHLVATGYDRWYEWFLEPLRGSKFKLFEIGLLGGASADLWRKYLPSAELFGMVPLSLASDAQCQLQPMTAQY